MRKKTCFWAVVLFWTSTASAHVLYVQTTGSDTDDGLSWATAKATVQAGLDAAAVGDEVWVAKGTYIGCITLKAGVALYGGFAGTELSLSQRPSFHRTAPDANETVLDGDQAGSVISWSSSETPLPRVDGFTIRNGNATFGGGIYCKGGFAIIANNTITNNNASYQGGGIYYQVVGGADTIIFNNVIKSNSARYGGGIHGLNTGPVSIANNMVSENTAIQVGGGLYIAMSHVNVVNNTIVGNSARDGGAFFCPPHKSRPIAICNTIIAFNSSGIYTSYDITGLTLKNNCFFGNNEYNFAWDYMAQFEPVGKYGNIFVDPKLAGWGYDANMHLQPDSPCVDAGDDSVVQAGWLDIDGQSRMAGTHVDIGADESDGTNWPVNPNVIIRVRPDGDDANDGSSWAQGKKTIQAAINVAGAAYGDVWVAAGTYNEGITIPPYVHVYGGFAGTEAQRNQRDWRVNTTILDGQSSRVASFTDGLGLSTLDGFTLQNGGYGIYCWNSGPRIENNIIKDAYSSGILCFYSAPSVLNNRIINSGHNGIDCVGSNPTILGNTITKSSGCGIICRYSSFPLIVNNFITNHATCGIECDTDSKPRVINCTITENDRGTRGNMVLENCIIWGNKTYSVDRSYPLPVVSYSCIQGEWQNFEPFEGIGNIMDDPAIVVTADGIPALRPDSPCIDAGDNSRIQLGILNDLAGNSRFVDDPETEDSGLPGDPVVAVVDMGAYEYQPTGSRRIYVNASAPGVGDGTSWATAFKYLRDALELSAHDNTVREIWVAAGTYKPDQDEANPAGTGDRAATFRLLCGISLYGGFAGSEDPATFDLADRDCEVNETILSGDLEGDDGPNFEHYEDNCTHVVTVHGASRKSILDGFTIRGGNATSDSLSNLGGGIYGEHASLIISNNMIIDNNVKRSFAGGGGIYIGDGSVIIRNNRIMDNRVGDGREIGRGGGIIVGGSPIVAENFISGNAAIVGGGICVLGNPTVTANIIIRNEASSSGGGINAFGCRGGSISNNYIAGNSAASGGAIGVADVDLVIAGNVIVGNIAKQDGGGIAASFYSGPRLTITNNSIVGNHAVAGGGIHVPTYQWGDGDKIENNVIAFNSSGIWHPHSDPDLNHNCLFGNVDYDYVGETNLIGTRGNVSADPLFVRLPSPGEDGNWGTVDDDYGDLRLRPGSPCVDAGNNAAVPAEMLADLNGFERFVDDPFTADCRWLPGTCGTAPIVDMGAYEYRALTGDLDGDEDVDADDLAALIDCGSGPGIPYVGDCSRADFDADGDVDSDDFAVMQVIARPGDPD